MNDPRQQHIEEPHDQATTCDECGAGNPAGATECSVCGSPIQGTVSIPEARQQPVQIAPRAPSSTVRDYILFGIGAVVVALLVYMISTPTETKGPPRGDGASAAATQGDQEGAMPPGHPPAGEAMTPEQRQQMEQKQKMMEARANDLRTALEAAPGNDSLRLQLANALYDMNDHAGAVKLYREILKKDPDNPDVRTDMAYSMANLNDIDGAIAELQGVVTNHPRHQNAALNLAMMYHVKGTPDSTLYWLKRVAAIDSTTAQGREAARIVADITARESGGSAPPHP